ncbi:ABC transporter substrate-binding protein [Pasteurellaceae bacterium USgator11]|nr:ABC transporter substrate-binding protein [Pasteurellaceae bacterium USgator41]TNG92697.1 ABC transporter substrate-binding protein [Pasteurellaceae bacterium UScroc12]TNG98119.1 ABC transporter substrate-binding protein [Pasteurellaceae bacterium USgator11]TNG99114.1 ABC transporter substrate-binding protein [Pasteurellaceae bacterium UScroc31]
MKLSKIFLTVTAVFGGLFLSQQAEAEGRLVVYCSAQNTMCEQEVAAFEKKYNVKTSFIRGGTGSIFARIGAEKANPQGDVWYGGTLDPHSQAGEMGLLTAYQSPNLQYIPDELKDPAKVKGNYTSAIYLGVLGFGVNTERLAKLNIPVPKCWKDLTDSRLKMEIQSADPQSSGTAYTALATFVQLWGEKEAFNYLTELHKNVSQYTKSGNTATRNTARGEASIGIGFLHEHSIEKEKGAPVELIVPCEGTGYEIGGVSIIKGARNLKNAKLFVDWALSKEAQELSWQKGDTHQILTNLEAQQSPYALDFKSINLINYDFNKYGAADERKRLIDKWINSVKLAQ